jgi:hypothetical protein
MSGKHPRLKTLESRKQLLIAESGLNRAHLLHELRVMENEVHALTRRAKTIRVVAPVILSLVAGLAAGRGKAAVPDGKKNSWWRTALNGVGLASSLWSEFRTLDQKTKNGKRRD